MMHAYEVGKLYLPDRTRWEQGADYHYSANGHELRLFYANLREPEIKAIRQRPVEFGAVVEGSVLFFLYKFQTDADWSDYPFNWHLIELQAPERAVEPPILEDLQRALLSILLVEATTGILKAIRVVSMSINLSRMLHTALRAQREAAFDLVDYQAEIQRIYATTETPALVQRAERMRVT